MGLLWFPSGSAPQGGHRLDDPCLQCDGEVHVGLCLWNLCVSDAKCLYEVGCTLNAATVEHRNESLAKAYFDFTPVVLGGEVLKHREVGPCLVQCLRKCFEICIASDRHPALVIVRKI